MIFVVDGNCLSIHTDNRKNNFLVMGERPTDDINGNVGTAEREIGINFAKADFSLYYNSDESYLYMNKGRVMACLQSRAGYSGRDGGFRGAGRERGFGIYFFVFFGCYWRSLISSGGLGTRLPPKFEIFLIFTDFLRS